MAYHSNGVLTSEENLKGIVNRLSNTSESQRIGCRKCGHAGHLTFQCYNTLQNNTQLLDVESTTSDSDDELNQLEKLLEEKKRKEAEIQKKKKKEKKKARKKRKRSLSLEENETSKKKKKRSKEKKKKTSKKDSSDSE